MKLWSKEVGVMNSCRRTKQNFEVFDEKDKKICKTATLLTKTSMIGITLQQKILFKRLNLFFVHTKSTLADARARES